MRLDAHRPGRLCCAEPDREDRPQRDRHLAEEVTWMAFADELRSMPSTSLTTSMRPSRSGEERSAVALVRRVLAPSEADVRRRPREPLPALRA